MPNPPKVDVWFILSDDRFYSTVKGRDVLSKAAENESTVTPASVHKHRVESLTGIREHTRKKLAVTKESPMTNAVLPKKQGGRDIKVMIEDALDIAFRIRRLAEKKGKSIEEIIMEELG
jgi:hypothetical protein